MALSKRHSKKQQRKGTVVERSSSKTLKQRTTRLSKHGKRQNPLQQVSTATSSCSQEELEYLTELDFDQPGGGGIGGIGDEATMPDSDYIESDKAILGWSSPENGASEDEMQDKDYPTWAVNSFKTWVSDSKNGRCDANNHGEDCYGVEDSFQTDSYKDGNSTLEKMTFSMPKGESQTSEETFLEERDEALESNISSSTERDATFDDTLSPVPTGSSEESGTYDASDADSLETFFVNVFRCTQQRTFETKEDLVAAGSMDDNHLSLENHDEVFSSCSSPRRSWRSRSIVTEHDMAEMDRVDSVIEMKMLEEDQFVASEMTTDLVEVRSPEKEDDEFNSLNKEDRDPETSMNFDLTVSGTSHDGRMEPDEDLADLIGTFMDREDPSVHKVPEGYHVEDQKRDCASPMEAANEEISLLTEATKEAIAHRTQLHWMAYVPPRKKIVIWDETSLPDNIPPMARLRYCRNSYGTNMLV